MTAPTPIDGLPPEARFALRAVAAGLSIDDAGRLLRLDAATVRKHLRTAARGLGSAAPPPSSGDDALLAALAPHLDAARAAPAKPASTRCPGDDILAALAAGGLDGPLLLAEIDHAADCRACLRRLADLSLRGAVPVAPPTPPVRAPIWPVVVGAAVGVAAAVWHLFG